MLVSSAVKEQPPAVAEFGRCLVAVVGGATVVEDQPVIVSAAEDLLSLQLAKASLFPATAYLGKWAALLGPPPPLQPAAAEEVKLESELELELDREQGMKQWILHNPSWKNHCLNQFLFWAHLQCSKFQKVEDPIGDAGGIIFSPE